MEARFEIGKQFKTRGNVSRLYTIVDILKTYNNANELVSIRYVATHEFCGQKITDSNVCEATVAMGAL